MIIAVVRLYDEEVGQGFLSVDPLAQEFAAHSAYSYVFNNPLLFIDPNGMAPDHIGVEEIYGEDENGNQVVTGYNITVTAKLINFSDNNVNLDKAVKHITNYIEDAFQGEFDGKTVSTNLILSVAETMGDVSESDHLFVLAEPDSGGAVGEVNDYGGLVAFIDADYFTGWYDVLIGERGENISAHELGHLFDLRHTDDGLMRGFGSGGDKLESWELRRIIGSYNRGMLNQGPNTGPNGLPNTGNGHIDTGWDVDFIMTNTEGRF